MAKQPALTGYAEGERLYGLLATFPVLVTAFSIFVTNKTKCFAERSNCAKIRRFSIEQGQSIR